MGGGAPSNSHPPLAAQTQSTGASPLDGERGEGVLTWLAPVSWGGVGAAGLPGGAWSRGAPRVRREPAGGPRLWPGA